MLQAAVSLGKLTVKQGWIQYCWSLRNEQEPFRATDDKIISQFKFKPFDDCVIFLFGFTGACLIRYAELNKLILIFAHLAEF